VTEFEVNIIRSKMSQAYCSLKTVNAIGRYSLAIKYWFCYAVEQHCWNDKNVSVEFKL